jgi:peroxiredoxin
MKHRKRTALFISLPLLLLAVLGALPAHAAFGTPITTGNTLEEFSLTVPKIKSEREYLGVTRKDTFILSHIPSKLVMIEVFSTICSVCVKTAPTMNKLYKYIQNDSDLSGNLKMIGIGQGDTDKKIAVWRKQMRVPFPLFSDPERTAFRKFGSPGTPYTVLIDNTNGKVLLTHSGAIKNLEQFLGELKEFNEGPK